MSVMLLTASAGILSGDCQEIRICVKEHAHMELLSQAYEKIHRMEEGFASRKVFICVEDHASLHYMPLPVIPFRDADYRSEMEVELKGPTSGFASEREKEDKLPRPSALGIDLPEYVEDAVMKAMAVKSEDRYQTVSDFAKDLKI